LEIILARLNCAQYSVEVEGYMSNLNYHGSKTSFILFVNGRLVDNTYLKRAIENLYANFLLKSNFPFVYLSIKVPSHLVDVNIHPSKRQVLLYYEQEIIQAIITRMEELLSINNTCVVPNITVTSLYCSHIGC
jgi:DNA mismatch repair protein MLH1